MTTDQATPTPGVGHDYIHMLTETVDPASGSLSVRIHVPVPKSLGLTMPFSFAYDSNGVTYPTGTSHGIMSWAYSDSPVESGGWTYTVPYIHAQKVTVTQTNPSETCSYFIDYMFTDPSGGRHALGLSAWSVPTQQGCSAGLGPPQQLTGGDDFYRADANTGDAFARTVDADGTLYYFPSQQGMPDWVEDRNGNKITYSLAPSPFISYTDSSGRTAVSVSSFAASGGDTVTVSGLPNPYHVNWTTVSYNYSPGGTLVSAGGTCSLFAADSGTHKVITSIELPNAQYYHFYYDATYGLLSEIVYPTGGWVKYTWGINHTSQFVSLPNETGDPDQCWYHYGTPVVTKRQVSLDGSTVADEQDFGTYTTTWMSQVQNWSSKSTTVVDTPVNTASSKTVYNYGSAGIFEQPNDEITVSTQVPVENQITYENSTGSPMRTVTKQWYDPNELACELETHDGSALSGVYYLYAAGLQARDKKEYDYGQITSTGECSSSQKGAPSTTATRETATTYDTSRQDPFGYSIEDLPSVIAISGASSAETDYSYDSHGNALTKTRKCSSGCPGNATTTYAYVNNDGEVTSMSDPKGNPTSYTYTCSDTYLSKITYPSGLVENFTYDCPSGELTGSQDESGNWTNYHYETNGLDRLTEIDYPDTGKTTYTYNDTAPNPSVSTCKLLSQGVSACSTTTMDGLGHAVKAVGENGAETDMTYDGEGQLYKQTNPGDPAHYMTYNHDALGRLSSTVYQDGSAAGVTYTGNCATTTDPAAKTNKVCTDAFGRATSDTDGLNNTTTYVYDALDNLKSVSQGGQPRIFAYNSLSELTSATNPESGVTSYTYDLDGNVATRTDARGIVTCYGTWTGSTCNSTNGYDADNRLLSKTYSDGTPPVNFTYGQSSQSSVTIGSWASPSLYNTSGRLIEATTTASGSIQTALVYSYDPMGRVANLWQCAPYNCGSTSIWTMPYTYDLAGDVTNYWNPAGFNVTRTINSAQQVTSQTYGTNMAVSEITYEPSGAISTMCGGQGCAQSQETRQYNSRLQPTLMELGNSSNLSADYSLTYSYAGTSPPCAVATGDNGNIMGAVYTDNVHPDYSHAYTYCYDGVNRLVQAIATGSPAYNLGYSYDQYGNPSCVGGSGGGVCPSISYNSMNRLTFIGGIPVNYDAAGNQLNDQYFDYQYDAEGRVKLSSSLSNPLSVCPTSITSGPWQCPVYNALGQRVEDYQADAGGNPMTLTYPIDIFGQRTGAFAQWPSQNWTGWNVYWAQVAGQRLNMGGVDAYIDHSDAVGSTTMETDPAGAVQWDVTHYPWGRVFQETGIRQSEVVMGLDWQVNDPVVPSATREFNFRDYRWMTPDPEGGHLENPQTLNKYTYAGNNPTSRNDPSGLDFYLSCQSSDHSGCAQVEIDKSKVWVQADKKGNATIITSDSIRAGENRATVSETGVVINGKNQGIYFDNPSSIRNGVDTNPLDLLGSGDFNGISFHLDANCGGTCLSEGTFSFPGDRSELMGLLKERGAWNYEWSDMTLDEWFYHRHSTQFRFGVEGSANPSPHFVVPNNPKNTIPFGGEFHVDRTANGTHLGCAVFKTGCL